MSTISVSPTSGQDNQVRINAAIIQAVNGATASNPGIVNLSEGTFYINDYVIPKSNVIIRGAGVDKTFIKLSGTAKCACMYGASYMKNANEPYGHWGYHGAGGHECHALVDIQNVSNVTLSHLTIDGSYDDLFDGKMRDSNGNIVSGGEARGKSEFNLMMMYNASNLLVDHVKFTRGANDAIGIYACTNIEIAYSSVDMCGHDGIQTSSSNSNLKVHHSFFKLRTNCGVRIAYGTKNSEVYCCEFMTGSGGSSGIEFNGACPNVLIHHNYFHNITGNGYGAIGYKSQNPTGEGHKYYNNIIMNCTYATNDCPSGYELTDNLIINAPINATPGKQTGTITSTTGLVKGGTDQACNVYYRSSSGKVYGIDPSLDDGYTPTDPNSTDNTPVSNAPVAAIEASPVYGTVPLKVQFSDKSTNSPTTWKWEFGDGSSATNQNPMHSYATVGTYTAKLTASNTKGSSSASVTVTVIAEETSGGEGDSSYTGDSGGGTGSSSNPGTGAKYTVNSSMTFAQISNVVNSAKAGETIYFQPGTYHSRARDDRVIIKVSGVNIVGAGKSTIIHGHEGGALVNDKATKLAYFQGDGVSNVNISYIAFNSDATSDPDTRGLHESRRCVFFQGGSNNTVHHCYTLGWTYLDVVSGSSVNGLHMHDCDFPKHGHCGWYGSYCKNSKVYNNKVGLWTNACLRGYGSTNNEFHHNTLYHGAGGQAAWEFSSDSSGNNIHHNIIYNIPYELVQRLSGASGISFNNNVYWNTGSAPSGTGNVANPSDRNVDNWVKKGYGAGAADGGNYDGPISSFHFSPEHGKAPLTVTFKDQSTGSPTSWSWSFGDGSTGSSQNTSHTFTKNGSYKVSLKVANAKGNSTSEAVITVSDVANPNPTANFSAVPANGHAPLTVSFSNASTNASTYKWDFGDGQTSTTASPSHTFTAVGTYSVKLTATNSSGSSTVSKTIVVTANDAPVAKFSVDKKSGYSPLNVTFTNTSTGATSYLWNFGDGQTSTATNPSHTFTAVGSYTVKLTATNSAGSVSTSIVIKVADTDKPIADFDVDKDTGNAPLTVIFSDTSTGMD